MDVRYVMKGIAECTTYSDLKAHRSICNGHIVYCVVVVPNSVLSTHWRLQ